VSRLAALCALLAGATPAAAIVIGGGGSQSSDCLVALSVDANFPVTNPKQVRCVDGDPTCDDDGVVNGGCDLRIVVCANSTFDPSCTLSGLATVTVENAIDNGDANFDPYFQALQARINTDFTFPTLGADDCTSASVVRVPIKGPFGNNACGRQKKKVQLRSLSTSGPAGIKEDKDTLKLYCDPAPVNGCDPQTLFTGTFDRIQTQVFNQSCAVSGCHDSQSVAGGLLLEVGASYGNLVGQPPSNFAAFTAGWQRVDAVPLVSGDPATSYLVHKIEGDLPDGSYGSRMPLDRPKLNGTLRDIIATWIQAGAPPTGWVPDTF
jgi:hypothetical protein